MYDSWHPQCAHCSPTAHHLCTHCSRPCLAGTFLQSQFEDLPLAARRRLRDDEPDLKQYDELRETLGHNKMLVAASLDKLRPASRPDTATDDTSAARAAPGGGAASVPRPQPKKGRVADQTIDFQTRQAVPSAVEQSAGFEATDAEGVKWHAVSVLVSTGRTLLWYGIVCRMDDREFLMAAAVQKWVRAGAPQNWCAQHQPLISCSFGRYESIDPTPPRWG